ncbi:MAG: V-type ATPase subunit [Parasporobacterium sp.]|nr:V-type ATPase subunit [Parasporobacterium sp.]
MDKEFLNDELLDDELLGEDLFTSAVAQIRAKENTLLNNQALNSLMTCTTLEECIQFLLDKGWGPTAHNTPEELITEEREKMWALIRSLCDDKQMHNFDIFRLGTDFHNLKAAIKESYVQKQMPNVYINDGTIPVEKIRKCAQDNDFSALPISMMKCAEEARELLFHTGDSQSCDCIIDRAALLAIVKAGKDSGNALIRDYAELKCAAADINIAIRACKANKDVDFLQRAFAECDSISVQKLILATRNGLDAVYEYLEGTTYADAIEAIKKSPASFDIWCDNRMMKLIKPQKYNAFTISPLCSYVLAKENELKSVKIILSGKANSLAEEKVRERIRDSYV